MITNVELCSSNDTYLVLHIKVPKTFPEKLRLKYITVIKKQTKNPIVQLST